MKALIIKPEPMKKILDGSKCWEIRRGKCHIRGMIGLIESGSGAVVGVAEMVGCVGPLSREMRVKNARKMGVSREVAMERWPRDLYAWVLQNRSRLRKAVPYKHPSGAIRWVPLSPSVEKATLGQLRKASTRVVLDSARHMTPSQLAVRIRKFRERPPHTTNFENILANRGTWSKSRTWYTSQKEHWLGWLSAYKGPGYYDRKNWHRSAEFVYNHIVCPPMVLWLGEASGVPTTTVARAKRAALATPPQFAAQCAAIRKTIPWQLIEPYLVRSGKR